MILFTQLTVDGNKENTKRTNPHILQEQDLTNNNGGIIKPKSGIAGKHLGLSTKKTYVVGLGSRFSLSISTLLQT